MTTDSEPPHAIYRYRDKRNDLLYIGRSNDPIRRAYEHRLTKDWITSAARIDLEWVPADEVHELERLAIESEHPRYNVQHNRDRIKVQVSAEVSVPSGNGLAAMIVPGVVAVMTAKWGFEAAANWSVKRRAGRAGIAVDLPPVRNPFANGGPPWLQALIKEASTPPSNLRPIVLPTPNTTGDPHALSQS